jgi:hypothetical protein
MVVNSINESISNHPLFLYIEIPEYHLFSAISELRLIDGNGLEVPTYVIYENRQGYFIRGVYLVASLSLTPYEAKILHIYYGNPEASQPQYRLNRLVNNLNAEFTQINLQNPNLNGPEIELLFGNSYSISTSGKLSYNTLSKLDFGPLGLASQKFDLIQSWTSIGNVTSSGLVGASIILRAGDVNFIRSIILKGHDVYISDIIVNEKSYPVNRLNYYFLINASNLATTGIPVGKFNPINDLASFTVSGVHIGVKSFSPVRSYQLSDSISLVQNLKEDSLNMAESFSGLIAMAVNDQKEVLNPGDHVELIKGIQLNSNLTYLSNDLEIAANSVKSYFLPEEIIDTSIPMGIAGYDAMIQLGNLTISNSDSLIDIIPSGHMVMPSDVIGQVSFNIFQEGDELFKRPIIWSESSFTSGTARSISSSSYWLDPEIEEVGYISAWNNLGVGNANASLSTSWISIPSVNSAILNFTYRADYNFIENISPPLLYLAIHHDRSYDNKTDQIIYMPVNGTKLPINESEPINLIGDGIWHELTIDISDLLRGEDGQVSVELFSSINDGFQGMLELSIDKIQIHVSGSAERFLKVTIDNYSQNITLKLKEDGSIREVTGSISFALFFLNTQQLNVLPDGIISTRLAQPSIQIGNSSVVKDIQISRTVFILWSNRIDDIVTVNLEDIPLELGDYVVYPNSLSITNNELNYFNDEILDISVIFNFDTINIQVFDSAGNPLSDVFVRLKDNYEKVTLEEETIIDGLVVFNIIPSEYIIQFFYHNYLLNEIYLNVSSSTTLFVPLPVYRTQFRALDQLGLPVSDVSVQITSSNGTILSSFETGNDGTTDFIQLAAKRNYRVLVYAGSNQIFEKVINTSIDGVTILLNTSYLAFSIILIIISLIIGFVIVALIVMRRRLPGTNNIARDGVISNN